MDGLFVGVRCLVGARCGAGGVGVRFVELI